MSVGKSYAINIEAEKRAFEQRNKYRGKQKSRHLHYIWFSRNGRVAGIRDRIGIEIAKHATIIDGGVRTVCGSLSLCIYYNTKNTA